MSFCRFCCTLDQSVKFDMVSHNTGLHLVTCYRNTICFHSESNLIKPAFKCAIKTKLPFYQLKLDSSLRILKCRKSTGLRTVIFSALNRSSHHRCEFDPSSSHMWVKPTFVRCFFSGISRFRPTLWLTRLKMREKKCTSHVEGDNTSLIRRNCIYQLPNFYQNANISQACKKLLHVKLSVIFISFRFENKYLPGCKSSSAFLRMPDRNVTACKIRFFKIQMIIINWTPKKRPKGIYQFCFGRLVCLRWNSDYH